MDEKLWNGVLAADPTPTKSFNEAIVHKVKVVLFSDVVLVCLVWYDLFHSLEASVSQLVLLFSLFLVL